MKSKKIAAAFSFIATFSFSAFSAETTPLTLPSDRWSVVSDNQASIDRWARQRHEAAALADYADKLLEDIPSMLTVKQNGGGPALLAFSKDINRTQDELDQLGPPFTSPFSYCPGVGTYLTLFWQTALGMRATREELLQIIGNYQESHDACLEQIAEPPVLKYTVQGPESEATQLPEGCLYIFDVSGTDSKGIGTWTCPVSSPN